MTTPRPFSFKALAGGVAAYVLVKLAAIGVVTGVTLADFVTRADLFMPALAAQASSELLGAVAVLVVLLAMRLSPRAVFLGVAAGEVAIGWLLAMRERTEQPFWLNWMIGASRLEQAWAWLGLPAAHEPQPLLPGLSLVDLAACATAGLVAQAVHNLVPGSRRE